MTPVDPSALDRLFAARGGFETAYEKLVAAARSLLLTYGGDTGARVVLRQLDPEEVVNLAFDRVFSDGIDPEDDLYLALRRHIQNHIRSLAKSAKQRRLVRVDGDPELTSAYCDQSDPNEESARDRLLIVDDMDFCSSVMFRVMAEAKEDPEVEDIGRAIISGKRSTEEICQFTGLNGRKYDAAFKRLKRRFSQLLATMKEDHR